VKGGGSGVAGVRGDLGRHLFGLAAVAFGLVALRWHDIHPWQQLDTLWTAPLGPFVVGVSAIAQIAGGAALQWRRAANAGAIVLGLVYLFSASRWLPGIVAGPLVYGHWGSLFEQLSLVSGALIVYGSTTSRAAWALTARNAGRILFGLCVVSFMLEQLLYLDATAAFVPKWLPPSQLFWAVITTIAFGLAAVSLLSGLMALHAARLLTAMIAVFGVVVWLPILIADPHDHSSWAGNAQNALIGNAAWIVADLLARRARYAQPRRESARPASTVAPG
jgi:hypothetical protein